MKALQKRKSRFYLTKKDINAFLSALQRSQMRFIFYSR